MLDGIDLLDWQNDAAYDILEAAGGPGGTFAILGGRGSAKSFLVDYLCAILACSYDATGQQPWQVCLAMDSHVSLEDIHQPQLRRFMPAVGALWHGKTATWRIEERNAIVYLRHLDMAGGWAEGATPIEGPNYDVFLGDELQNVDPRYRRTIIERTRVPRLLGQVDGRPVYRNPVRVLSGLTKNAWWRDFATDFGGKVYRPKTRENVHNRADYEADLRREYTEREARAFLDGEDYQESGGIYGDVFRLEMEPLGNITARPIDHSQTRTLLVVDPGVNMPFATMFANPLGTNVWVMVKNWAPDGRENAVSIPRLAGIVRRDTCLRHEWNPGDRRLPIDDFIADPVVRARSQETGRMNAETWALMPPEGIGLRPRWNMDPTKTSVDVGIQRVQLAMERRRLLIHADLVEQCRRDKPRERNIIRCIEGYARDKYGDPIKGTGFDDGCDTIRYAVMGTDMWTPTDAAAAWGRPQFDAPARKPSGGKGGW